MTVAAPIDLSRIRKPVRTLFGWLFFRRISAPLSAMVARTRALPWQITAAGLAFGIGGAGAIATGNAWWMAGGGIAVAIAKLLDAMDGEVARAKHLDTPAGYVADGLSDRLRDTSVLAGCAVGAHALGSSGALGWGMGAIAGYLAFFYVSAATPAHWREVRQESDVDEKHMFRVSSRIRLGAGDTLAVLVLGSTLAGLPLIPVIAVATCAPLAIAAKTRRLFISRPWERA